MAGPGSTALAAFSRVAASGCRRVRLTTLRRPRRSGVSQLARTRFYSASCAQHGVNAYEGSIRFLELAREAQLGLAIVSASANTLEILERAGLLLLVDQVVDGNVMSEERLPPKPAPDSVLAACRRLGVGPAAVATFDTTAAGTAAGRSAGVGQVIAVNRGLSSVPRADIVVSELADLIAPEIL